jgi:hypothetical protein
LIPVFGIRNAKETAETVLQPIIAASQIRPHSIWMPESGQQIKAEMLKS